MTTTTPKVPKLTEAKENEFAKKAFEALGRIEDEAKQKKLAHLESLNSARTAIVRRLQELKHQLKQLDEVIACLTGRSAPSEGKRRRKDWSEVRERVCRWLEGRRGRKFSAGDLVREFPELDGLQISLFLKPLIEAGTIKADSSEGPRRTKYFAEDVIK